MENISDLGNLRPWAPALDKGPLTRPPDRSRHDSLDGNSFIGKMVAHLGWYP